MNVFEYDAIGHRYLLDGTEIPGVTRVINDVLLGGHQWADEAAMWRGSVVHMCCQMDDQGTLDEESVDPGAVGYLAAWRTAKAELTLSFEQIEQPHGAPDYRFGGRPDRVIRDPRSLNGGRSVLDLKSGSVGVATNIQLAAYCILTGCYGRVAVRLTKDGKYSLTIYPVADCRRDQAVFLNALAVWNWRRERRMA